MLHLEDYIAFCIRTAWIFTTRWYMSSFACILWLMFLNILRTFIRLHTDSYAICFWLCTFLVRIDGPGVGTMLRRGRG
ncbi:hypothetical protein BJY04DRAFT_179933 [Aspergillus karnatakaensis]|uniref:uncharacterized protein n=1 Tax=Aspergillus karnatakaensis TaxID=1810916 RepID=UPI003CCD6F0D